MGKYFAPKKRIYLCLKTLTISDSIRGIFYFFTKPPTLSFHFRIIFGNQIDLLNTKLEDDSKFEGNRTKESLLSCEYIRYNTQSRFGMNGYFEVLSLLLLSKLGFHFGSFSAC